MKKIEIKTDVIFGTSNNQYEKHDYTHPKFESGDFFTEDPRNWLKDDIRSGAQTIPRCDTAVRLENGGMLFLVWYRGSMVGERGGDGRFVYIFIPFELKWPGNLADFLKWVDSELRNKGKLPEDTEKKWSAVNCGKELIVPKLEPSPRKGKYAYINCGRPQGPSFEDVINMRFQKVFSEYCWVVLSTQDARESFKVTDVVDITDKIESYCQWNPMDCKAGEWYPQLWMNEREVAPNTIIFDDKACKYQIEWKNPDPMLRYSRKVFVSYGTLLSKKLDGFLLKREILEAHTLPLQGNNNDIIEALEYKRDGKCYKIEYIKKDNKFVVFLPVSSEEISLDDISIKSEKKAFFEKIEKKNEILLQRKEPSIITEIKDGKHVICQFDGKAQKIARCLKKENASDDNVDNTKTVVYRLKTKIAIPLFVVCVTLALLVGTMAGFFIGKHNIKEDAQEATESSMGSPEDIQATPSIDTTLAESKDSTFNLDQSGNATEKSLKDNLDSKNIDKSSNISEKNSDQRKVQAENKYTVTVEVDNHENGDVSVSSSSGVQKDTKIVLMVNPGEKITLTANPHKVNKPTFKNWSGDGIDNKERSQETITINVTKNNSYYKAIFNK